MKSIAAIAVLAALAATAASGQMVGPVNPTSPVCLQPALMPDEAIPRTKVLDPQHVLFYTRDGRVWMNRLRSPCRGLMFHGFSVLGQENEICSNATAIHVIESGETCQLGAFTPYTPPPAAP